MRSGGIFWTGIVIGVGIMTVLPLVAAYMFGVGVNSPLVVVPIMLGGLVVCAVAIVYGGTYIQSLFGSGRADPPPWVLLLGVVGVLLLVMALGFVVITLVGLVGR